MEYPTHECGHELCFLDRLLDECPACMKPIPIELRLTFDFYPMEETNVPNG